MKRALLLLCLSCLPAVRAVAQEGEELSSHRWQLEVSLYPSGEAAVRAGYGVGQWLLLAGLGAVFDRYSGNLIQPDGTAALSVTSSLSAVLSPGLRYYFTRQRVGALSPFAEAGLILMESSYSPTAWVTTLGVYAGAGVEYLIARHLGLGASFGAAASYDVPSGGVAQPGNFIEANEENANLYGDLFVSFHL